MATAPGPRVASGVLSPKPVTRWLLVDALGALLSALAHGVVLRELLPLTGMPTPVLGAFAVAAATLAAYSATAWRMSANLLVGLRTARRLLRGAAVANLAFAFASAWAVVAFWPALTILGVGYFAAEIAVVTALAAREWQLSRPTAPRAAPWAHGAGPAERAG